VTVPAADNLRAECDRFMHAEVDCVAPNCYAADMLDAIDALHQQGDPYPYCRACGELWPCPTARILHPEEET
jgi:hypothetical protein